MSEASTGTIRVADGVGETIALNLGTQLAVVEDGQCYFIDLSSTGEALSVTPAPVIYRQKIDSEGEVCEGSPDESIPLRYYSPNTLNDADGQQVFLDDEQARAVANLLEFHNQQNKTAVGNSLENLEPDTEVRGEDLRDLPYMLPPDFKAPVPVRIIDKNQPLRTYGKRGPTNSTIVTEKAKMCDTPNNVKIHFEIGTSKDSNSNSANPTYILPTSTVAHEALCGPRRKRRIFVDTVKMIPPGEFKQQLIDTSDIVQSKVDTAPPTKKAMYYLAYGGVGKFFAYPGRKVPSVPLSKLFFSRLTMMTEPKAGNTIVYNTLEPLDSDLRTPGMKDYVEFSTSHSQPYHPHLFNDAVAKRTASSFDSLCKGMSKPPKFEYKRKKSKYSESAAPVDIKPNRNIVTKKKYSHNSSESKVMPMSVSESVDQKSVLNGNFLEVETSGNTENSANEVVYTINEDASIVKSEQSTEIFVVEENESGGAPSNFEMLIAAAEHHNNLDTSGEPVDGNGPEEVQNAEIKEENEVASKAPVVYCTNEMNEQLIILGAHGERYRVTASNQGELTLWPEAECDDN